MVRPGKKAITTKGFGDRFMQAEFSSIVEGYGLDESLERYA
jgi:hypothetical protein